MRKMVFILSLLSTFAIMAAEAYQAGQEKSIVCAACHGPTGISSNPEWPTLSGQHASYLIKQLQDFKAQQGRSLPTMTVMVMNLSPQDMKDLAAFYASQPLPDGTTPKQYLKRGEQLYSGGDFSKHITACIACHGPKGHGNAEANFPTLSGQHAAYTILQLQAFKTHSRRNDLNAIMQDISSRMSTDDMRAVAHYIEGLH